MTQNILLLQFLFLISNAFKALLSIRMTFFFKVTIKTRGLTSKEELKQEVWNFYICFVNSIPKHLSSFSTFCMNIFVGTRRRQIGAQNESINVNIPVIGNSRRPLPAGWSKLWNAHNFNHRLTSAVTKILCRSMIMILIIKDHQL